MAKHSAVALVILGLTVGAPSATAQQKAGDKGPAAASATGQAPAAERTIDKASPILMKNLKVVKSDPATKRFVVVLDGKELKLTAPDHASLPKAGASVRIAVSDSGGGCTNWYDQHHKLHKCPR